MPRVHYVKKARKDNPVAQKGEPYYWWKFRYGGKRYSKTYPKASQLTQSDFLRWLYDWQEQTIDTWDALQDMIEEFTERREECEESLENMPDSLRESSASGELLQLRVDMLEEWVGELEGLDEEEFIEEGEDGEEFFNGERLNETVWELDPGLE